MYESYVVRLAHLKRYAQKMSITVSKRLTSYTYCNFEIIDSHQCGIDVTKMEVENRYNYFFCLHFARIYFPQTSKLQYVDGVTSFEELCFCSVCSIKPNKFYI